jgi:excisionase family DNA binding protein
MLTTGEVAVALRTTRKAIYAMIERAQLPGIVRIGRRVLVRQDALLDFLDHNSAPSPQETRR